MSTLTYETAARVTPGIAVTAAPKRKGFWSRVFDRLIEARTRQANEFIARNQHLLHDLKYPRQEP